MPSAFIFWCIWVAAPRAFSRVGQFLFILPPAFLFTEKHRKTRVYFFSWVLWSVMIFKRSKRAFILSPGLNDNKQGPFSVYGFTLYSQPRQRDFSRRSWSLQYVSIWNPSLFDHNDVSFLSPFCSCRQVVSSDRHSSVCPGVFSVCFFRRPLSPFCRPSNHHTIVQYADTGFVQNRLLQQLKVFLLTDHSFCMNRAHVKTCGLPF